jgi:hypothetical protein
LNVMYRTIKLERHQKEFTPLKNPIWVFTNFANSRGHCDPVVPKSERFEGLTNWRLHCIDETEGLPKGEKP